VNRIVRWIQSHHALDALARVMLNALVAKYGKRDEFFRLPEQVNKFLGSTERDRAVGLIPRNSPVFCRRKSNQKL